MSLEIIRRSLITVELTGEDDYFYSTARLTLPFGSEHTIGFVSNESAPGDRVTTTGLEVPEEFQKNGIATRLLKTGFSFAKSNGIETSRSHVSSPYALMARLSIFGDENITICDDDANGTPLGISVDEAIDALERGEREYGFVVVSSLVELNTIGWESFIRK